MGEEKLNFLFTIFFSIVFILFYSLQKMLKTLWAVMEVGDGFMQFFCGKVGKQLLKMSKGIGTFIKVFRLFYKVKGLTVGNIEIHSEKILLLVFVIKISVLGFDNLQAFPFRISALFLDFFRHKAADQVYIFHQPSGFCEDFTIDSLQNIFSAGFHQKGIIDMPRTVRATGFYLSLQSELGKGILQFFVC